MTDVVGARWIRAALQVNPYQYQGANAPSTAFSSESDYNSALLDECAAQDIGLIAVTDHWCIDTAVELIEAADARGIVALPGFEANSSEGVHLLVIFEAGTEPSAVNAAIGACGVDPGCNNGTTGSPFKDILESMTARGALVIPAHINVANSGMLMGRTGPPLIAMVKHPNLHAVAITPSQPEGTDQDLIIKGARPYDRRHPLAVLHADDIVHPRQLSSSGATSWFKVSSTRLDSLKLAVRTPQTRVALTDPRGPARAMLKKISWTGGFLDGVSVPISSDLTALIGGRGTGKSTVIESLRYALGLVPIGKEAGADHKAIVDKVLRSGTVIQVELETVTPQPRRYTIERVVPSPPVVRDSAGTATNQQPGDVVGLVEVFGQHELAELANNPTNVADMLHRFAGSDGGDEAKQLVRNALAENRAELEKAESQRASLLDELADIPRLEEQVQHFKDTDVAKRLADMRQLGADESVFHEASQRIASAKDAITALASPQLEGALAAGYEGAADSPQSERLELVAAATRGLAASLKELADQASAAILAAESEVNQIHEDWEGAVRDQRDRHAEVLRKLHEEGLEPDRYLDVSKALGDLKAKEPRLATHGQRIVDLKAQRDQLIGELSACDRQEVERLHEAIRAANDVTGGVVVVRPVAAKDRDHIMNVIGEHVSGAKTQIAAAVAADDFSPRAFVAAARSGLVELERLGIRGAQASNLVAAGEALFRRVEEMSVGHAVEVLLDISSNGGARELKPMDELSKGQRATALLLLLLGASTAPLVIDQPEDDLDNRFVYDGVVAHLRRLKGVRQIIASTHNANVPVLGDAELIVALEGDGQHGRPAPDGVGSLDDGAIRSLVENLLEGGPAAFNARQHLYGF